MQTRSGFFLFLSTLLLFVSSPAQADWVNFSGAENAPNIAEIYIEDDHVKVILEVYIGDLEVFEELIPEDMFQEPIPGRPSAKERLRIFSEKTFQFKTDDGKNLPARLEIVEPRLRKERPSPFAGMINPYTRQPIPGPPEDKRVLYAELVYPFKTKPEQLTIVPPLGVRGMAAATIGFTTYHKEAPINDFKYLSEPSTLQLDWDDPWYSHYDKKALKRWQKGGVMSFLYIEPFEVRHEVLARVKDLEAWIDLDLRGDEFIEEDEVEPLKKRVGEYLLNKNTVLIDGKSLRPILDRTAFIKYSMTGSQFLIQPERLPLNTAMLGVIITFITEGIPQEVTVNWELFSDRIQKVPTNAVDPAGPFPSYVTPDDNIFKWTNFLKTYKIPTVEGVAAADSLVNFNVPVGSLFCVALLLPVAWQIRNRKRNGGSTSLHYGLGVLLIAGSLILFPYLKVSVSKPSSIAPKLQKEEASVILHSLLKNVYRAFDFREEEDVYDKLAISASGDLLADIYLQNRKSFEVKRAGGAQAKVKEVEILDVSVEDAAGRSFAMGLKSRWTAMGTVGHWGHIHTRQNEYDAVLTVEPVDGFWKITGLELLEEKRIDPMAKPKASVDSSQESEDRR
jgi:hypothetical protein